VVVLGGYNETQAAADAGSTATLAFSSDFSTVPVDVRGLGIDFTFVQLLDEGEDNQAATAIKLRTATFRDITLSGNKPTGVAASTITATASITPIG